MTDERELAERYLNLILKHARAGNMTEARRLFALVKDSYLIGNCVGEHLAQELPYETFMELTQDGSETGIAPVEQRRPGPDEGSVPH